MMCKDCQHAGHGRRGGRTIASPGRVGRLAAWRARFATVFVAALCGAAGARAGESGAADVGATAPVTVQLWPTAVVTSERTTLDDVGRILPGDEATVRMLRACEVAVTPPAGSSTVITLEDVAAALARAGISPARVILRGSSRCQIVHPADADATTRPAGRAANGRGAATRPAREGASAEGSASRGSNRPAETGTLGAALEQYLAARLADQGGTPEIRFSPAVQRAMALSSPAYEFRIRQRGNDVLGLVSLEADVFEGGKLVETIPVVAEVALVRTVVVARSAINRGEIIQAKHLALAERRFSRLADVGISDLQSVIGQEANRYIENGAMLTARDIRARPLVKRGDIVTVWVRQGDLVIKSAGKALRAGTYGEMIDVKNESTGEVFLAAVTGPQTAEIGRRAASHVSPAAPGSSGVSHP